MAGQSASKLRIAVAHDWLVGYRGGEAVLESILKVASSLGEVDAIYTMFDAGKPLAPHIDQAEHVSSMLSSWGTPIRRWLLPLYHLAVEDLSDTLASRHRERPIDLVISTSSAAVLGIVPPPGVPHLCYLHAPARYLWSQSEEYAKHSLAVAVGLGFLGDKLRNIDCARASTISRLLANSSAIAAEAKWVYGLHATVVHPGVRTEYFTPPSNSRRTDQWLTVGALEPYKRVDLAIHAANATGHTLLVVGRGSCIRQLRAIAGPTVQFLGHVDDEGLRELYRTSRVLLFPQIEDFGIVAVEAQACGLPVVGRAAGGALDTVIDGVTGSLFSEPSASALLEAIARAPAPDSTAISQNAARFSVPRFEGLIKSHVLQLVSE